MKTNQLTLLPNIFCLQYFYTSKTSTHRPDYYHGENKSELKVTAK